MADNQLALDFGGPLAEQRPPPRPASAARPLGDRSSDLLFFAIFPDPAEAGQTRRKARLLSDRYGLSGALTQTDRLHLSLQAIRRFDGIPDDAVAAARTAGSTVREEPFEVTFDLAMGFRNTGRCPYVLRCADAPGLVRLQRSLTSALQDAGAPVRGHGFTPHVTLLYEPRLIEAAPLDPPLIWTVRDFTLVHSVQGQGRHHRIARFALG